MFVALGIFGATELGSFWVVQIICAAIVQISFAVGVLLDSSKMKKAGGSTFIVPGWVWAIATLFGGVVAVIGYWLIHHSSLRRPKPPWIAESMHKKEA